MLKYCGEKAQFRFCDNGATFTAWNVHSQFMGMSTRDLPEVWRLRLLVFIHQTLGREGEQPLGTTERSEQTELKT